MQRRAAPKRHPGNRAWLQLSFAVLIALLLSSGCTSLGPARVPPDRFSYNKALADSTRDQMLLNLVRLRYLEEPVFLSVSSILTQYVYNAGASVEATIALGGDSDFDTATPGANLSYEERPTITYLPIEGQEFAKRMLSSMPVELIFTAAQEGWTVEALLKIGVSRIGPVENMSYDIIPSPGQIDLPMQYRQEVQKLKQFRRAIGLLVVLSSFDVMEFRFEEGKEPKTIKLLFAQKIPEDLRPMAKELRQLLGLSSKRNEFVITQRTTNVRENEISIQT